MPEGATKENNVFLYLLLGGCLIAIAACFYFYYFKKDYEFVVEVACDTTKETCIQRDCTNEDNCPPNQLSDFKRYNINAGDFDACTNENCAQACEEKIIPCKPIECVEDFTAGESCSTLEEPAATTETTTSEKTTSTMQTQQIN